VSGLRCRFLMSRTRGCSASYVNLKLVPVSCLLVQNSGANVDGFCLRTLRARVPVGTVETQAIAIDSLLVIGMIETAEKISAPKA
jgi:hypothetical protein